MTQIQIRWLFFVIGLIILSFGISLTIIVDFGVGAWDALNVALSSLTGLTVGNWVIIIGAILMFVNAIIAREKLNYLSLVTIFIVGFMIDFWLLVVMDGWQFEGIFIQVATLILGLLILGFGVALYLQPKLTWNPVDGLMVALQKRFHLSSLVAKTITETFALVLAFLLNGPIGIGTFIILVSIGPSIQLFEPVAVKMMNSMFRKNQIPVDSQETF